MRTPYIPHYFGDKVEQKLAGQLGWLTAGVASSIPWPKSDIWIIYNGDDFIIRGTEKNGEPSPPCITVPCQNNAVNESLSKIYRLTSVLSWFKGGYVDVSGYVTSSHPILYGDARNVFSNLGLATDIHFNCNHLPVIDDDNARKALAFWREGCRLIRVHDSYAFLSFFKVIESQFNNGRQRQIWIEANIDHLPQWAANRVEVLRADGVDVSSHIYESGRCAVAHASLNGEIIDPDIPEDRRRISADLDLMQGLAMRYISHELKVPNESSLYKSRNRLEPLVILIKPEVLVELNAGTTPDQFDAFNEVHVSICIWPEEPVAELKDMQFQLIGLSDGIVRFNLTNKSKSIYLEFVLDFPNGKAHTLLENSGLRYLGNDVTENDVITYSTYFNQILCNRIAEIRIDGCDPIDCEVVIPMNIIPMTLEETLEHNLKRHKQIINQRAVTYF
ncbi:MAG: hypothetical protein PHO76_08325 [Methylotenera sp.]|jgi:hypothetical protein|nr:hypothetical protein [Methylotenera sp.]MDD4926433.1 hypothetical protein [Methylotenera sp.]